METAQAQHQQEIEMSGIKLNFWVPAIDEGDVDIARRLQGELIPLR